MKRNTAFIKDNKWKKKLKNQGRILDYNKKLPVLEVYTCNSKVKAQDKVAQQ